MYTYDPTDAADTTAPSPMYTWSPMYNGKKATLLKFNQNNQWFAYYRWYSDIPWTELLERWSDYSLFFYDAIAAGFYISQIASNYGISLNDDLSVEDNILRSTEHCLATDLIPRSLYAAIWDNVFSGKNAIGLVTHRLHIFIFAVIHILHFHVDDLCN